MRLNKNLRCLLIITLSVVLVGCGSSGVPSNNAAGQPAPSFAADDPDGASQEPVSSDIDIMDSNENKPENSEQTLVSTTQSTNADNYWQGDDFFDVIGYLKANGATDIANGLEDLPVNGKLQTCYWETECAISGWNLRIDWMSGQVRFENKSIACYCGRNPDTKDFITGNENGSPIPRHCIDYLTTSLDYIMSADPNTTACPYCGLDVNDPAAAAGIVNESPFPHTHAIVPQ